MAAPFHSAAATLLVCVLAGPAAAVTVSEADADLMFVLKKIYAAELGGIEVGAAAALNDQGTLENPGGHARSDYDVGVIGDPLNIGIGDGVRLGSGASTSAIGPSGLGDAFTYTDGAITIRNNSSERARLKFVARFDLSAAAGVDVPDLEAGYARASVGLEFGDLRRAVPRREGGRHGIRPPDRRAARQAQGDAATGPGRDRDALSRGRQRIAVGVACRGAGTAGAGAAPRRARGPRGAGEAWRRAAMRRGTPAAPSPRESPGSVRVLARSMPKCVVLPDSGYLLYL